MVLDLISYENANFFNEMYLDKLRSGKATDFTHGSAHRYVLPILSDLKEVPENVNLVSVKSDAQAMRCGSSIIVTPEILTEVGFEYPVVNKRKTGKKNTFFYATGTMGDTPFRNSLTKFDTAKKVSSAWIGSETQFPGEPQLILNPNGVVIP